MNMDQDPAACQPSVSIPSKFNVANASEDKLCVHADFDGCPFESDPTWQIAWPNTPRSTSSSQSCPGGLESIGECPHCKVSGSIKLVSRSPN